MKKNNRWVLWPSYFDVRLKRREGRRVPKKMAVESPSLEMIGEALKSLGIDFEVDENAAFPSQWYRREGRIFVSNNIKKNDIIKAVSRKMNGK
ncbi:MAG: hypothetical protein KIY12_03415 [Thermoplasmata archaeon]|uniref:Signal recognition particle 19 kDa protein n=1 Tax=Candidatus Sysuiplasma superficiale TaxID=2823368 RepID=A0A8J7YNQ9_9ARCH|nr:hypothetical protein [Candidatus Sysuiplasma superficiale]MBX8643755.1 hypothetical protein [Candidatus Sysuiplasma superficiale]MCL4346795.1 hypothetical protein [Candidatus Thermoplasmatota archaeon]MCL5437087.1 hypothetical protein [Candidatus Thermoplasmatota archaeon]